MACAGRRLSSGRGGLLPPAEAYRGACWYSRHRDAAQAIDARCWAVGTDVLNVLKPSSGTKPLGVG